MINVNINNRDVNRTLNSFSEIPGQVIRAKRRALKTVKRKSKSMMQRDLARANNLPVKALRLNRYRDRVRGQRQPDSQNAVGLWVGYKALEITLFKDSPRKTIRRRTIAFRGQNYPNAFWATFSNAHTGIFERTGNRTRTGQRAIQEVVSAVEYAESIASAVRIQSGDWLQAQFISELKYETTGRRT